jgi:8-oxo-(d)GTP phosphatase
VRFASPFHFLFATQIPAHLIMKIFVNDLMLNVLKQPEADLPGVLLNVAHAAEIMAIYEQIKDTKVSRVQQYNFLPEDYAMVKRELKANFEVVEAAGGLVRKGNSLLLIKRFGKWDLPKGKLEPGEGKKTAAVREVEEECGVKAKLVAKVGTTWHTYVQNKQSTLKKTTWYLMDCLDDSRLKPQASEAITKVRWAELDKVAKLLEGSYASIRYIFQQLLEQANAPALVEEEEL